MRIEKRRRGPISEINVTPMVDVMLVLLIIFMVTAPLFQQGIDVNLPVAKAKEMPHEERIIISIDRNGTIMLDNAQITLPELGQRMKEERIQSPSVFLRADKDVPYGIVVRVMGEVKEAGIEKLGMVTEPEFKIK